MTANTAALLAKPVITLPAVSTFTLGWLASLFFLLLFNQHLFSVLAEAHGGSTFSQWMFLVAAGLLALALINLLVILGGFGRLFKLWLILLLLSSSLAAYFTNRYGVIIDRDMVRNIAQTDWREALELLNSTLLLYFFALGVVPSILVARLKLSYTSPLRELFKRLLAALLSVLLIGAAALTYYQEFASIFRNHRELRYLVVPTGYVHALYTFAKQEIKPKKIALKSIGMDAHPGALWNAESPRKAVVILVVGETARAQNFALNGYSRPTNPELSHEDLVNFDQVHSCGTATAVSLPCMFSREDRSSFDADKSTYQENLLDVVQHAGISVLWRDNNSGCKGVCDRVGYEEFTPASDASLCDNEECFDMILLKDLEQRINQLPDAAVIVLHQKGSHGPAYYLRSPKEFQQFVPVCHTNQLQQCSKTEILNAYDNTILYTDHVLANLIGFLKLRTERYDSALVYVSDHGESLSENNLYLHGLPYAIAPDEQTHIPFFMWFSERYSERFGIDTDCLNAVSNQPYSHDNLFDTVLGLLDIKTSLYRRDSDMLASCSKPR
ncbi:MAG: phosphoethanolamine--lipid A transferase [Gammaproteobacteria bacterium]